MIWEEKKRKKRFKALNYKESALIEKAYTQFVDEASVGKTTSAKKKLDQKLEVSVIDIKPIPHPCPLANAPPPSSIICNYRM